MKDYGAVMVTTGKEVVIPEMMGIPRVDQMQGTLYEQLAELAGRVCYDSLGSGRSSEDFHRHILQVGHTSIYEHCNFTIRIEMLAHDTRAWLEILRTALNHPGLFIECDNGIPIITFNVRTVLDWVKMNGTLHDRLYGTMMHVLHDTMPAVWDTLSPQLGVNVFNYTIIEPPNNSHKWVTFFMWGSRGFSHEQVRHGDFTAISQRSTRYVDESETRWVAHPIIKQFHSDRIHPRLGLDLDFNTNDRVFKMKEEYIDCFTTLESYLVEKGLDKGSARKQARGAARGLLGNALQTQMIFSASLAQWERMILARCNEHADAEIACIYKDVVDATQGLFVPSFKLEQTAFAWKAIQ